MLNKVRSALYSAVSSLEEGQPAALRDLADLRPHKFPYGRPAFLSLASEDEMQAAGDRSIRPIMVPRDVTAMPWMAGYAECVNAGKSKRNEDNACVHVGTLRQPDGRTVRYHYFGVFDGHAGYGASVAAANQLHHIVHEKLADVIDHLLPSVLLDSSDSVRPGLLWVPAAELSIDKLVTGALEAAFHEMDALIAEDRRKYEMRGGCTALVGLFLLGRLYVANAGDSRAIVCRGGRALVASHDFTPETERQRVRQLASRQPGLLGGEFTHLEFCRRVSRRDLGKRLLYRDAHMTGWAYKTVTEDDIKFPVVCGEGKRSRVCATIGVTRGFGDHGLRAQNTNVYVKPFLLSQPEVLVINLEEDEVTASDVLVMGTDGLWDVTANHRVAEIVERALKHFPADHEAMGRHRFTSAAQELVMAARGKLREHRQWRMPDGSPATLDDVSVFVIPLLEYRREHLLWKAEYDAQFPCAATHCNGATETPDLDGIPVTNGTADLPDDPQQDPAGLSEDPLQDPAGLSEHPLQDPAGLSEHPLQDPMDVSEDSAEVAGSEEDPAVNGLPEMKTEDSCGGIALGSVTAVPGETAVPASSQAEPPPSGRSDSAPADGAALPPSSGRDPSPCARAGPSPETADTAAAVGGTELFVATGTAASVTTQPSSSPPSLAASCPPSLTASPPCSQPVASAEAAAAPPAPLVLGQTLSPTLVQTVPRSSVKLLPPSPPHSSDACEPESAPAPHADQAR